MTTFVGARTTHVYDVPADMLAELVVLKLLKELTKTEYPPAPPSPRGVSRRLSPRSSGNAPTSWRLGKPNWPTVLEPQHLVALLVSVAQTLQPDMTTSRAA